jgi:hypothetical protein
MSVELSETPLTATETDPGRAEGAELDDGRTELDEGMSYTAAEVDAAIAVLGEPGHLAHAQEVVTHAAPALEHVLASALHEGGWFGSAYESEVSRAAGEPDATERARVVGTLVAEQTRLGMFVGVAVGFELARELQRQRGGEQGSSDSGSRDASATSTDAPTTSGTTDQATPTEE